MSIFANVSKIARVPRPPAPGGHAKRQASRPPPHLFSFLDFKNILVFRPFLSPKIPRKHQGTPKKNSFLPCFALIVENLPRWKAGRRTQEGRARQGANEGTEDKRESGYLESLQKVTTPPICGATSALYPHNFSHQKSRKKFAPRNHNFSHQKYRKKSPWSDWKKFRKKFAGKCFGGKRKPPIL